MHKDWSIYYRCFDEIERRYDTWRRQFPGEDILWHFCREDKIHLIITKGTEAGTGPVFENGTIHDYRYFLNIGTHLTYFYYPADDLLGRDDARRGVMEVVQD